MNVQSQTLVGVAGGDKCEKLMLTSVAHHDLDWSKGTHSCKYSASTTELSHYPSFYPHVRCCGNCFQVHRGMCRSELRSNELAVTTINLSLTQTSDSLYTLHSCQYQEPASFW